MCKNYEGKISSKNRENNVWLEDIKCHLFLLICKIEDDISTRSLIKSSFKNINNGFCCVKTMKKSPFIKTTFCLKLACLSIFQLPLLTFSISLSSILKVKILELAPQHETHNHPLNNFKSRKYNLKAKMNKITYVKIITSKLEYQGDEK